jgi:hypothetical protein
MSLAGLQGSRELRRRCAQWDPWALSLIPGAVPEVLCGPGSGGSGGGSSWEIRWAKGLISDEVFECPLRAGTCGGVWCVVCEFCGEVLWVVGKLGTQK